MASRPSEESPADGPERQVPGAPEYPLRCWRFDLQSDFLAQSREPEGASWKWKSNIKVAHQKSSNIIKHHSMNSPMNSMNPRILTSSASTCRTSVALGRYVFIVRDPRVVPIILLPRWSICTAGNALPPRSSLRRCFTFQGDLEGDFQTAGFNIETSKKCQFLPHLSEKHVFETSAILEATPTGSWPSNSRTTMAVPQRVAQLPRTTAPLRQRAALRDTVARPARTPRGPLWLRSRRAARFRFLTESSVLQGAFIELWRVGEWGRLHRKLESLKTHPFLFPLEAFQHPTTHCYAHPPWRRWWCVGLCLDTTTWSTEAVEVAVHLGTEVEWKRHRGICGLARLHRSGT